MDVSEDGSVAIELSGTDAEGSIGGYEVVTEPENGELSGDPPSLTYTPNMDFNGTDGFLFSVVDGDDVTSEPARVSINVTPVNDAPVAVAQSLTITDGESIDIVLEGTDIDGTVESYEVLTEAQHGTLTRTPPEVTYTPNADFSGQDTFTFNVTDNEGATSASAEVVIEVAPCADDRDVLEALYNATSGDDWGGEFWLADGRGVARLARGARRGRMRRRHPTTRQWAAGHDPVAVDEPPRPASARAGRKQPFGRHSAGVGQPD